MSRSGWHCRTRSSIAIVLAVLLLGAERTAAQPEFFDLWTIGGPFDQRIKDIDRKKAGIQIGHSGLVGFRHPRDSVRDGTLGLIGTIAALNGARCAWALGTCFSGGVIDEMSFIAGPQSITTAARFWEKAHYPLKAPAGVDRDWVDAYEAAMAPPNTVRTIAAAASTDDPWGTNPAPPGGRLGEGLGSEHPEYWSNGVVPDGTTLIDSPASRLAILWSGQPNTVDRDQIVAVADRLVAAGWSRADIKIFYGSGMVLAGHPIAVNHINGLATPVQLVRARRCHLQALIAARYGPDRPNPAFLYFFANDHGFTTDPTINCGGGVIAAQAGDGGGVDEDAMNESGQVGEGDNPDFGGPEPRGGCVEDVIGACCLGTGLCTLTTDADCAELGGLFGGDSTVCAIQADPKSILVDPFLGPCLMWGYHPSETDDIDAGFVGDTWRVDEIFAVPSPGDWPLARLSRAITAPDDYEAQLTFSWEQAANADMMSAHLVLLDEDDAILAEVGVTDDTAAGAPVATGSVELSGTVTGAGFSLNDGSTVRFEVVKCGTSTWQIAAQVDGQLLVEGETSRIAAKLEIHLRRSSAGDPFGSITLDHVAFGGFPPPPCVTSVGGFDDGPARVARLLTTSPHPFRPGGAVRYELAGPATPKLTIFDVAGRAVRSLVSGQTVSGGSHSVSWDGRSDAGQEVPAGVYFLRLEVEGVAQTERVVLLR